MTTAGRSNLDVMVVAGAQDFEITRHCLRNIAAYLPCRRHVYLVTDDTGRGQDLVDSLKLAEVAVVPDNEVLSASEMLLPGWYKQQIIKLRADRILNGDILCVLSGDTLLARTLPLGELIAPDGSPYLYVNRYRYPSRHLSYERDRVRAVAELLGVAPTISLTLGDFITDLFCFERATLSAAITRLEQRLGTPWTRVLEGRGTSLEEKSRFGEYTLYAVTALELTPEPPPVRVRQETHILQLHSRRSLGFARFDAPIVHIADKRISVAEVAASAVPFGVELCLAED